MASITDDLKYLSRYGYRDPWAEAVKEISGNLFALSKTKMQRDSLLAQIQQKKEQDGLTADYNDKKLVIDLYNSTPDESKSFVLPSLQKAWGEDSSMAPVLDSLEETLSKTDEYNTTWDNLFTSTKNNELSIDERFESSQRLVEIANNPAHRSQAAALLRHYGGKRNEEQQKVTYMDLGEMNKTYLGDFRDEYNSAVQDGNFTGATHILNSQISKTGKSVTAISSMYDVLVKNVTDAETAFNKGEGTEEAIVSATAALDRESKTLQAFLPPQYRNVPFADGLQAAVANADISTKKRNDINKGNNGTPPPQTQTTYNLMNDVSESNMRIPSTAIISLINPRTNKRYEQRFTSDTAQRIVETGQGIIDKQNAMIEFEWAGRENKAFRIDAGKRTMTYQSVKKPLLLKSRNERIELKSGDEVMEKSSGTKFPVVIDNPPGNTMRDKIGYIVNGKRYNFQEFINKFGKPMYEAQEVDARKRTFETFNSTNQLNPQNLVIQRKTEIK